jgi:RimJ/RimL family protein N-acetyltransferase
MIQPLSTAHVPRVGPLFGRLAQGQPMCTAVLEGIYPGKIYTDDSVRPWTALLTTYIESEAHGAWCFLAGDPTNHSFNQSVNAAIFSRQIIARETPFVIFTCDPDDWAGQMGTIMAPHRLIWIPRYHFISRQARFDWQAALPAGFTIERMSEDLRRLPGLHLPKDVATTLSKWQAMTDPRFMDSGFAILDRSKPQPVVASWATVDFIAAAAGDLGFFTTPDYRHRNLGTIAASATLERAFALGLRQVNWTCDADNPGSVRTAEKLGLERLEDYHQAVLIMDEKNPMTSHLERGTS